MGYTRYWTSIPHDTFDDDTLATVRRVFEAANTLEGIVIAGPYGTGTPEVTAETIAFNGAARGDLDHESAVFVATGASFGFCKTARKPYDAVLKVVLEVLEDRGYITKVFSDGKCEMDDTAEKLRTAVL